MVELQSNNQICNCFYQIDIAESWGWRIYWITTRNWRQIRKWFWSLIKKLRVVIEIIEAIFLWFWKQQVSFQLFFEDLYLEKWWLTDLPGHDGNRREIWIWFEDNFKEFRVRIEILVTVFGWVSKQQSNLLLFLSDWYYRKLGLTDLPGNDRKVMSDKKMILITHQKITVVLEIIEAIVFRFLKQQVNFQLFF